MKKSRFTEEQIAFALKQTEIGTPVNDACRTMGISDATFYNWRKKYGDRSIARQGHIGMHFNVRCSNPWFI